MATPPPGALNTSFSITLPSSPTNLMVSVPLPGKVKSVARYWSPKAWRPMMIGLVQPGTRRGTLEQMIGSRKMTPPRMLRMVPLGALPHLLQVEFLHPRLVGGDGGAFHADAMLLDGVGGIDRHLVAGPVAILDREIVIVQVDIEIGMDELGLDEVPDDAGHLVAVELDDRIFDLDLRHRDGPRAAIGESERAYSRGLAWEQFRGKARMRVRQLRCVHGDGMVGRTGEDHVHGHIAATPARRRQGT